MCKLFQLFALWGINHIYQSAYLFYLYFLFDSKSHLIIWNTTAVSGIAVFCSFPMLHIASQSYKILENHMSNIREFAVTSKWRAMIFTYTYTEQYQDRRIIISRLSQYSTALIRSEERKRSLYHSKFLLLNIEKRYIEMCLHVKIISKIMNILNGVLYWLVAMLQKINSVNKSEEWIKNSNVLWWN